MNSVSHQPVRPHLETVSYNVLREKTPSTSQLQQLYQFSHQNLNIDLKNHFSQSESFHANSDFRMHLLALIATEHAHLSQIFIFV